MRLLEKIKNFFFWGWKLRNSYDFDMHSLYELIYLKLLKSYDVMENHSHLMWNSSPENKDMKRMREAKELAFRLMKDDYFSKQIKLFESKYGKAPRLSFKNGEFTRSEFKNPYAEKAYFNVKRLENKLKRQDKTRLFYLLDTYIDQWWD